MEKKIRKAIIQAYFEENLLIKNITKIFKLKQNVIKAIINSFSKIKKGLDLRN